jgi:hypothetical protein
MGLSGFVFPIPTFVCTVLVFFGRLWYTIGYTNGYGKHAITGLALTSFAQMTVIGMVLIVTL